LWWCLRHPHHRQHGQWEIPLYINIQLVLLQQQQQLQINELAGGVLPTTSVAPLYAGHMMGFLQQ
jgi:hypothetical protein